MTLTNILHTNNTEKCLHGIKPIDPIEMIGKVFGKYKILEYAGKSNNGEPLFITECLKCGYVDENPRTISHIQRDGNTNNCCHNYWKYTQLRNQFFGMKQRCYDENSNRYSSYGGRGIRVYQEWLDKPWEFQKYALSHGYVPGLSIDRINNDGNYEPGNVQWISRYENNKKKRATNFVTVDGVTDSCMGWSKTLNLSGNTVSTYLRTNGYNETVLHLTKLMHPDKIVPCVIVEHLDYECKKE